MQKIIKYSLVFLLSMILLGCDPGGDTEGLKDAIKRNKFDIVEISILPMQTVTVGNEDGSGTTYLSLDQSEPFKALGITSGGEEIDLTTDVNWSSSNSNIVTVSQSGVVTTFGTAGSVSILAEFAAITGTASVEVSAEALSALVIGVDGQAVSSPYGVNVCTPIQFVALGTYGAQQRYITHAVDWTISHTDKTDANITLNPISRISNQEGKKGLFGAWDVNVGSNTNTNAVIQATSGLIDSSLALDISGSIAEINISPNGASLAMSTNQQFSAFGKYVSADTVTTDFTEVSLWSTPDTTIIIDQTTQGLITAGNTAGVTTLNVTCGGQSTFVDVTVTDEAKIEYIAIDYIDDFVQMTQNETVQLKAEAHYSDGRTPVDITKDDNTNWSVRALDTSQGDPINVTNSSDPVDKGEVSYIGEALLTGEKRFAEVVVKYNNDLQDDIVVVVTP